jgi:hypothetical protein
MPDSQRHLDVASKAVIVITLSLFVAAVFVKGFGHDLLLEAGVFLVSVKLIMMAYANSQSAAHLDRRLDDVQVALTRLERVIGSTDHRKAPSDDPMSR